MERNFIVGAHTGWRENSSGYRGEAGRGLMPAGDSGSDLALLCMLLLFGTKWHVSSQLLHQSTIHAKILTNSVSLCSKFIILSDLIKTCICQTFYTSSLVYG